MNISEEKYMNLYHNIQRLKKAECHVHIDGALDAEDVLSIIHKKNLRLNLPYNEGLIDSSEKIKQLWRGWGYYKFLDQFGLVTGLMQSPEDLKTIAKNHVTYIASQNIIYLETRFAPQYHLKKGLSLNQVMGYVLEGLQEGAEKTGITTNLIISIGRETDIEKSKKVVKAALTYQDRGVVGIDLACEENNNPPEKHYDAFKMTFDSNLKRTLHSGEMCETFEENLKNIETSIDLMRADGISHAINLRNSEYHIQKMIEKGIRLESNPISNKTLKIINDVHDLRLDYLLNKRIPVTVNSDDPSMWSNGSLTDNLYEVTKLYGLDFLKKVLGNQIKYAFGLNDKEKKYLLSETENQGLFKDV
ncbi:hypothetical protein HQ533_00840 [Candidatus Woesearchaeota archaeon]|nr:hypothetical protein [Candidatus Woesearchaeota archaeon]